MGLGVGSQLSVISSLRKLPTSPHPTPHFPLYFNLTAIIAKL
ncbi:hypothetical protein BFG60_1380 [Microcystis aeruginosa NIES-98]|nr:hypothetical protein BFG60_1380 [Microcystis aeruginosa NIES-98]